MAIRAASPLAPFWYTPKGADEGEKVRFRLRGMTALELMDVNAQAITEGESMKFTAQAIRTAMRSSLLGWEEFLDSDGNPVEFGKNVDANLARIPFDLMAELFGAIVDASKLSGEQAKN